MTDFAVMYPQPVDMNPIEVDKDSEQGPKFEDYATIKEMGGFTVRNTFFGTTFPSDLTGFESFIHGEPIPVPPALERGISEAQYGDERIKNLGKWLARNGDSIGQQETRRQILTTLWTGRAFAGLGAAGERG